MKNNHLKILQIMRNEQAAAFLALIPTKKRYCINGVQYNVILISPAPVHLGGRMILVPSASIQPAQISIENFMHVYIFAGASSNTVLPTVNIEKNDSCDNVI